MGNLQKVWWHYATLFKIYYFLTLIYALQSHSVHPSVFLNPHRVFAQQGEPPWDAEPRFELGPALQQADALPTELRRILISAIYNTAPLGSAYYMYMAFFPKSQQLKRSLTNDFQISGFLLNK